MSATTSAPTDAALLREARRRRTFAIISHPDAGKTTLTEKFLLYAGAIEQAGEVKSRKAERTARSDWMELEQQRGISISSTVLRFDHDGHVFNLLDTPGHRDFSEDTYRVLSGVDAAIMVLDGARGVEPQTKKLFEVCRRRGTAAGHVREQDGPSDDGAAGGARRHRGAARARSPRPSPGRSSPATGSTASSTAATAPSTACTRTRPGRAAGPTTRHRGTSSLVDDGASVDDELELLDEMGNEHDLELFRAGETTPVFFGSALSATSA